MTIKRATNNPVAPPPAANVSRPPASSPEPASVSSSSHTGTAASHASLSAVLGGGSLFKNLAKTGEVAALSTVERGSRGPQVAQLKTLLRDAGFYHGPINDEMGAQGIEALQKAKLALKLTGPVDVAGPTTFAALEKAVAQGVTSGAPLSNERNHQFTLDELTPAINANAQKYGVDPKLLAGIIKQESTYKNHIVHDDGTGHGLIGLDDNGLKSDFEKWSGTTVGTGADAASIQPEKQIEFLAKTLSEVSKSYYQGDQFAAAREWHTGPGGVNSADGREYEQLVRGHMGASDIANLKQTTASAATTPTGAAPTPPSGAILGKGDSGPSVSALQQQLVAAGASIEVDGVFGPLTEAAVRDFQQKKGLTPDGTVGPQTSAALQGLQTNFRAAVGLGSTTGSTTSAAFDVRAGSRGPQVTELKTALKKAGFYDGAINDQMGSDGLAALKTAKEKLKLGGDPGVAGATTMKALLSAATATSTSTGQVKLPVMAQGWGTDCGLTSVAMIANGLRGTKTDSAQLERQYGYSLMPALEGLGVKAVDHGNLHAEIATEDQAWQIFSNAASKGHPVLFGANNDYADTHWSGGAGHYMAATGVSEVNGVRMITFNDPNGGVVRTVPFNHLWNAGLRNDGNCVIECS